jgi:hypothetical protein
MRPACIELDKGFKRKKTILYAYKTLDLQYVAMVFILLSQLFSLAKQELVRGVYSKC